MTFAHSQCRNSVYYQTNNGDKEHPSGLRLSGFDQAFCRRRQDKDRADNQYHRNKEGTQKRKTFVAIAKTGITPSLAQLLQIPSDAQRQSVPKVVQGIGEDRDTRGEETAYELEESKGYIKPKSDFDVTRCRVVMMPEGMVMPMMIAVLMLMSVLVMMLVTLVMNVFVFVHNAFSFL